MSRIMVAMLCVGHPEYWDRTIPSLRNVCFGDKYVFYRLEKADTIPRVDGIEYVELPPRRYEDKWADVGFTRNFIMEYAERYGYKVVVQVDDDHLIHGLYYLPPEDEIICYHPCACWIPAWTTGIISIPIRIWKELGRFPEDGKLEIHELFNRYRIRYRRFIMQCLYGDYEVLDRPNWGRRMKTKMVARIICLGDGGD